MKKPTIQRKTTVADLRGPSTLRSGLVSKLDGAGGLDGLEPCELIGEGKYGVVHKMMEKNTGQLRVVKTVERPNGWDDQQLKLEAEILQNLDHPHILRIFSWYEDGDAVNIVMEHCEGGELMKVVKEGRRRGQKLPEMWAATAIRQCFEALVYLHTKGIVHKDLKSANILLLQFTELGGKVFGSAPHVVICDLGLAEVCGRGIFGTGMGGGRARRVAGTPVTMAPEVWKGSFGPKSDVWSMGVVMFELLTGKVPFMPDKNEEAQWAELHRKGPNWSSFEGSKEALKLCELLLTVTERNRPTAAEVLEHAWMKNASRKQLTPEEIDALVRAVRTWSTRNSMQRALSLKMASGCTCLKKFAVLFSQFDTDNSGILDQGELLPALESLGMETVLAKEIAASLDVNNDGSCEYLEFAAACLSSLEDEFDELLRQEFNVLDVHWRGELTDDQMKPLIDELRPLALAHGLELQDIDANGDGAVSFSEFCEYFGRPGAVYENNKEKPNGATARRTSLRQNHVKQLPMKQQIRIMRHNVEEFKSAMQASIEASYRRSGGDSLEFVPPESIPEREKRKDADSNPEREKRKDAGATATKSAPSRPSVADRILLRMQRLEDNIESECENCEEQAPPLAATGSTENTGFQSISFSISWKSEDGAKSPTSPKMFEVPADSDRPVSSQAPVGTVSQCSQMSAPHEPCVGCWMTDGPFRWLGIKGPLLDLSCGRHSHSGECVKAL